jgi:lipopolysaccharide export system permease protein
MKIWERHLLGRLFKTLALILAALFCVYVLIDLSIHSVRFLAGKAGVLKLFLYYLHSFSRHLDLFFSLAFLLTILRVLIDLAQNSELIALHMAGLSKLRLSRPLFMTALCLTLLSYANAQWLAPDSLESIDMFRVEHAKRKKTALREHVNAITLDDGSEIVYQSFDPQEKTVFDVYWIRNKKNLWHIKTLELGQPHLIGHHVDCFQRSSNGQIELVKSHELLPITDLPISESTAMQKFISFENRPLATLFIQSFRKSADKSAIRAHLHYKLSIALLPLLIALTLPPSLLGFSRTMPIFLIASASLFVLIAFLTLLDGMLILAENKVLPPAFSIWILWIFCFIPALKQWIDKKSVRMI